MKTLYLILFICLNILHTDEYSHKQKHKESYIIGKCAYISYECIQEMRQTIWRSNAYKLTQEAGIMGDFRMSIYILSNMKIVNYKIHQGIYPSLDSVIISHMNDLDFILVDSCLVESTDTLEVTFRFATAIH